MQNQTQGNFITIDNKKIGQGHPAYIIAEMSANHGGDFERAADIIHAAQAAGADAIKLQTYTADTLTLDCRTAPFDIESGPWAGPDPVSIIPGRIHSLGLATPFKRDSRQGRYYPLFSPF